MSAAKFLYDAAMQQEDIALPRWVDAQGQGTFNRQAGIKDNPLALIKPSGLRELQGKTPTGKT
jgi:hypothetical protein